MVGCAKGVLHLAPGLMKSCLCDIGDGHGQIPLKCKSKVLFGDWEERSGGI